MQSVQSYSFSLLNMQICGVLVAVVDVVAQAPYFREEHELNQKVGRYFFDSYRPARRASLDMQLPSAVTFFSRKLKFAFLSSEQS